MNEKRNCLNDGIAGDLPSVSKDAVLLPSTEVPDSPVIRGYDFNNGVDYDELLRSYATTGFQASSLAMAASEINRMILERDQPVPEDTYSKCFTYPPTRRKRGCTIFLAYTSNLVSAGLRETIHFLAQHDMIDCLVTSAGGIEEDFIKCLAPTFLGDFSLKGAELRRKGINRTGNLLVPNSNYCKFEDWVMPLLDEMLEEQRILERDQPVPEDTYSKCFTYPPTRRKRGCTIFLAYTSNLVSAGLRETIRFLAQHDMIDCLVTSAGGIEEDFIKCLAPTFLGDFSLKGAELRRKGINRTGNLLVPNSNYCKFEDWVMPLLDEMLEEQRTGKAWNVSDVIHRLGDRINDESSIYYWTSRNNIPVFCPGITDGSLGDMLYFHSYRNPGLVIDCVQDIRRINDLAVKSVKSGMIILGGGVVKHHTCNANLMRNGADYSVYVNTGQEFDGSDAGARPDEAISWGKIKIDAHPVKVYCDATIAFPLLVAQTFAKRLDSTNVSR